MRPSTRLFHVSEKTKPEADAQDRARPPTFEDISWDEEAPRGVTAEAWHKARGWASED